MTGFDGIKLFRTFGVLFLLSLLVLTGCSSFSASKKAGDSELALVTTQNYMHMLFRDVLEDGEYDYPMVIDGMRGQVIERSKMADGAFREVHPEYRRYQLDMSDLKFNLLQIKEKTAVVEVVGKASYFLDGVPKESIDQVVYVGLEKARGEWMVSAHGDDLQYVLDSFTAGG